MCESVFMTKTMSRSCIMIVNAVSHKARERFAFIPTLNCRFQNATDLPMSTFFKSLATLLLLVFEDDSLSLSPLMALPNNSIGAEVHITQMAPAKIIRFTFTIASVFDGRPSEIPCCLSKVTSLPSLQTQVTIAIRIVKAQAYTADPIFLDSSNFFDAARVW
ncbi:hypothetical protein BC830DRAFT_314268 [Chytriomyces sp. MP71]|nr:hypothetical protein BC830DRAFT_314268 [Chytriomyces sp. MP71]